MRATKLICVEGLPGLGKTTTASWLAARLRTEGATVNLLMETQPDHPLNVGGDLFPAGDTAGEAFFQHYTPASFIEESLEKWEAFVRMTLEADVLTVLDSYPFQNSVRILLQLNATLDQMRKYMESVEALTKPLQPLLVYLSHRDAAHVARQFSDISVQRGSLWTDYVVELITRCPYARIRHYAGFSGVLAFLSDYKALTDGLLCQSSWLRVVLVDCAGDWARCYGQIMDFLRLA
jgi:hypothetical protein